MVMTIFTMFKLKTQLLSSSLHGYKTHVLIQEQQQKSKTNYFILKIQ